MSLWTAQSKISILFFYTNHLAKRGVHTGESWKIGAILQICPGPGSGHSVFLIFELSYTFCIMAFWLYVNYSSGF